MAEPRKTPLYDWHQANRAKLVAFAGWDMPVQYPSGIIQEHIATRRGAGLFDVSHMGRFQIRGPAATKLLSLVLTNDPLTLVPGRAHYSFVANEQGGAVDDVFLYQLRDEDYLLVVNADNRATVWEWLQHHNNAGAELQDDTDASAMIALQGPLAEAILSNLVPPDRLPENKRNRISSVDTPRFQGLIARTGYTGEKVCFEIFTRADLAAPLVDALVSHGATPAGLGARDSLRIEAGLPLYGHELSATTPILANTFARFAIKPSADRHFVGHSVLGQQLDDLTAWQSNQPLPNHVLPDVIQSVRITGGRRPLRQGYSVLANGKVIGEITSGTAVPHPSMYEANDAVAVVPIGLARIHIDAIGSNEDLALEIADARGNTQAAIRVGSNLDWLNR
ncbi:MAG: glycine cleavage system aminomethyltransferase GcvT [Pseudomonadota bacterium]